MCGLLECVTLCVWVIGVCDAGVCGLLECVMLCVWVIGVCDAVCVGD